MAINLPNLEGQIVLDTSQLDGAISRASAKGSAIGSAIGSGIGNLAAGGIDKAVGAVSNFISGSISQAGDLNETMSKTQAIFGESSGSITDWSKNAATSFGLSQQEALTAASSFGDMFLQLGATGTGAATSSKGLVQMAADLGSFSNVDPTDVLQRIQGAMRGEYDSLQALIPNINAARVEQEALKTTGKKSAKELTALEKAQAVQAIITKDGARAVGDFAKTADGAANKQRTLTAQTKDQQAALGQKLLPAYIGFLGVMQSVVSAIDNLVGVITSVIDFIREWWDVVLLVTGVLAALTVIVNAQAIALAIYNAVVKTISAATKIWAGIQAVMNAVLTANPIGLIILAIVALVVAIVIAYKRSATFRAIVQGAFTAISIYAKILWTVLKTVFTAIVGAFKWVGQQAGNLKTTMVNAWNNIKTGIANVVSGVISFVRGIPGRITGALGNLGRLLYSKGRDVIQGMINGLRSIVGTIASTVSGIKSKVTGALSGAASWLYNTGSNIVQGLINGITSMAGRVVSTLVGLLPAPLRKFASTLGISSPSTVFRGYGGEVGEGFALGMEDMVPRVTRAALGLVPGAPSGPGFAGAGAVGPGAAGNIQVKVFIGERELTSIIKTEVTANNTTIARQVAYGVTA